MLFFNGYKKENLISLYISFIFFFFKILSPITETDSIGDLVFKDSSLLIPNCNPTIHFDQLGTVDASCFSLSAVLASQLHSCFAVSMFSSPR
jgi:hypothetical protein